MISMSLNHSRQGDQATRLRELVSQVSQRDSDGVSHAPTVVVSAGCGGLGVTTVAIHLARAFARAGRRCALVDANVARPGVVNGLDIEPHGDLGDVLAGRYRLGKLLGVGASGRVYEAVDEVSGQRLAIKLLAAGHVRARPAYERFVREARVASSLIHPNIVEVYDFS